MKLNKHNYCAFVFVNKNTNKALVVHDIWGMHQIQSNCDNKGPIELLWHILHFCPIHIVSSLKNWFYGLVPACGLTLTFTRSYYFRAYVHIASFFLDWQCLVSIAPNNGPTSAAADSRPVKMCRAQKMKMICHYLNTDQGLVERKEDNHSCLPWSAAR